jgi:hypothetical protein
MENQDNSKSQDERKLRQVDVPLDTHANANKPKEETEKRLQA